jgi:hypothetical protein
MRDKHQETGAPTAPMILTVPAYSFVVALQLDSLCRSNRAAFSDETVADADDGEPFETKDPALGAPITRVSSAGSEMLSNCQQLLERLLKSAGALLQANLVRKRLNSLLS